MAFPMPAEALFPGPDQFHWLFQSVCCHRHQMLEGHILPAAESPADAGDHLADAVLRKVQQMGKLPNVIVGPLGSSDDYHTAFFVYVAQASLRLEEGMLDHWRPKLTLDHHIRSREGIVYIPVPDFHLFEDIASPFLVHQRRIGGQGGFHIAHHWQWFVIHVNQRPAFLRCFFCLSYHQCHRIPNPAGLAPLRYEDLLIHLVDAELVDRHVLVGEYPYHARHRLGFAGVYLQNFRMGIFRPHGLGEKHSRHLEILRIPHLAPDFGWAVKFGHTGSYESGTHLHLPPVLPDILAAAASTASTIW